MEEIQKGGNGGSRKSGKYNLNILDEKTIHYFYQCNVKRKEKNPTGQQFVSGGK